MNINDIEISWVNSIRATDVVKDSFNPASQQIIFLKQKDILFELFQVNLNNHRWTVMKDRFELESFIHHLQKKYAQKLNKPKLIPNAPVPKILHILNHESQQQKINIRLDKKIIDFFEIQDLDFHKIKSLQLNKKSGGRYVDKLCCSCTMFQWKERHFVITENGILYYKQKLQGRKICQYISFNKYFSLSYGLPETGYQFGIKVKSYHRKLLLTTENFTQFIKTVYYLDKAFKEYNLGRHHNLYNSFSAPKQHNSIQFLVDGEEYFKSIAQSISKAKHQVMIAGWWISPQFYLIRPIDPKDSNKNRFSTILKQIIDQNNVKVYILAYRQSPMFLPNDSNYTKQALQKISPNIKVITHPLNIIPSLWSHHQKMVIIDQKVAYLGGLDICYGRYDTNQHSINDKQNLYPGIEFNNSRIKDFSKVRDYQISGIMRSKHPRLPWHDISIQIIGESVADVARHFIEYWNFASYQSLYQERVVLVPTQKKMSKKIKEVMGEIKKKIFNSKEQQKNQKNQKNLKKNNKISNRFTKSQWAQKDHTDKQIIAMQIQPMEIMQKQVQKVQQIQKIAKMQKIPKIQQQMKISQQQPLQQQVYRYTQANIQAQKQQKELSSDQAFKKKRKSKNKNKDKKSPRKSSLRQNQKENMREKFQKLSIRKKIKKIFVSDRKDQQQYYDSDNGQYLNQRSYDSQINDHGYKNNSEIQNQSFSKKPWEWMKRRFSYDDRSQQQKTYQNKSTKQTKQSITNKQVDQIISTLQKIDKCQILRSVSKWSIGCKENQSQSSIHQAYLDMIRNSQHFIYIENQFFMSAIKGQKVLKNQIAITLIQRITKAIKQQKKFKVIVLMPLIPGFAGQLDEPEAVLPRVIMHWQYLTIYSGENSVLKSIQKLTQNPSQYIEFYGLRTHDLVNNEPKTQIIYIHTKLMIVDDKKAILGSANINDRSMRGTRDSQIAIKISSGKQIDSIINGQHYKVNKKIKQLRIRLLYQHFGALDNQNKQLDFTDPLNPHLTKQLSLMVKNNTQTYRKLFGCYPDNQIKTLKQIKGFKRIPSKQDYLEELQYIKGNVVYFPFMFLQKENLLDGNSLYPNGITT